MSKKDIAKAFVEGLITEETFTRSIEKENKKTPKKTTNRKKRVSKEEREARSDVLLCLLALEKANLTLKHGEKTGFDMTLSEICGLSDTREIRSARSALNKLLKKHDMRIDANQGLDNLDDFFIEVVFVLKERYRRVVIPKYSKFGVFYANIDKSCVKRFRVEKSDHIGEKSFSTKCR